jgi:integrase/recombinase XerD
MSGQTLSLPSVPIVTIFVRHSADCPHKDDEFHRNCRCRKHLRWTYAGQQERKSAKTRSWLAAERARRKLETQYEAADPTKPAEVLTVEISSRPTVARVRDLFLSDKRSQGIGSDVLKKYERELTRFSDFLDRRSRVFPHEILLEDLTEFRANWNSIYPSSTTRSKVQERLRGSCATATNPGL